MRFKRKTTKPLSSDIKAVVDSASSEKSSPDAFSVNYINKNYNYFNTLLGNRLTKNKALTNQDLTILKEAYDKAHSIRNTELDLFWKRATYCFTLIAALITITGVLVSSYLKDPVDHRDQSILWIIISVSILGIVFTIMSNFITISGEYWKKNWEMHITMLEPLFSGNLYSTHLINSEYRTSIARATTVFFLAMYIFWASVIMAVIYAIFKDDPTKLSRFLMVFLALVFFLLFFLSFSTVSKNKTQKVYLSTYDTEIITRPNCKKKFMGLISSILKKLVMAIIIISFILICMLFIHYGPSALSVDILIQKHQIH